MFSLIYGFVEYMCKQDEFHVLILGLDKAGKTNVLEKLKTLLSDLNGEGLASTQTLWAQQVSMRGFCLYVNQQRIDCLQHAALFCRVYSLCLRGTPSAQQQLLSRRLFQGQLCCCSNTCSIATRSL